jgi:hypothetical protein
LMHAGQPETAGRRRGAHSDQRIDQRHACQ